jgi:hypothetical protein
MATTKRNIGDDAEAPTQEAGSHVRMRRDPQERVVVALTERYTAGEITFDELVTQVKDLVVSDMRYLTADEAADLRALLDKLDWESTLSGLRDLGP